MQQTSVEEVRNLRLSTAPITCRARCCEKIIIKDGLIVVRLAGNKWWCNQHRTENKFIYIDNKHMVRRNLILLDCLVELDMLSPEARDTYAIEAKTNCNAKQREDDERNLHHLAKKLDYVIKKLIAKQRGIDNERSCNV